MLGTVGSRNREVEQLRDRLELAETVITSIEAADETLKRSAPEMADSNRYELVTAVRRGVKWWRGA